MRSFGRFSVLMNSIRRWRRLIGVILVLAAIPPLISLSFALGNRGYGSSIPARAAEWTRLHGAGIVVGTVENFWYAHHQPPPGGIPKAVDIPSTRGARPSEQLFIETKHMTPPRDLHPFFRGSTREEGVWHAAGRSVHNLPAVYETYLRPDKYHSRLAASIAWFDMSLLQPTLYSGSMIPGDGPYHYQAPISKNAARSLVAAFNSGFQITDSRGGYYTEGHTIIPLRSGAASLVIYRDGTIALDSWGARLKMSPKIVSVRQNLPLLVNDGKPAPGLNPKDTKIWGATLTVLNNSAYVNRSGLGITRSGALIYVAGQNLNITDIANTLVRAGAVRAMELDMNTMFVFMATYNPSNRAPASPVNQQTLYPKMNDLGDRFFQSWWVRDFYTLSAR